MLPEIHSQIKPIAINIAPVPKMKNAVYTEPASRVSISWFFWYWLTVTQLGTVPRMFILLYGFPSAAPPWASHSNIHNEAPARTVTNGDNNMPSTRPMPTISSINLVAFSMMCK